MDPTGRAKNNGYNTRKTLGATSYSIGVAENISKMPTGNVSGVGFISDEADELARNIVQDWMNSPGHRRNILTPEYEKMGAGVAKQRVYYLSTQLFF